MTTFRRALPTLGLAVLLAVSGCGETAKPAASAAEPDESASATSTQQAVTYPTQKKKACDILTPAVAKALLGSVAGESGPAASGSSPDVQVSSCVRANDVARLDKARSVSLLMRVARTETGAQSNAATFEAEVLPAGAEPVSGYGERAFWNPKLGQLNILANGNSYVLYAGPTNPKQHTLAETRKLADAIADQF